MQRDLAHCLFEKLFSKRMRENMQEDSAMILLDGDSQWSDNAKVVAHWARFDPSPKQESIPQKVEQQALFIKKD